MQLSVNSLDEYRPPARRPWLLLVVIAVGAVLFLTRDGDNKKAEKAEREAVSAEAPAEAPEPGITAEAEPLRPVEDVNSLMKKANALIAIEPPESEPLVEARDIYYDILSRHVRANIRSLAERRVGEINIRLAMTPMRMPEKVSYVVRRGDSLDRIAKRFGTTVDLVQRSNLVRNPNLIREGDNFLVFSSKLSVVVSKTRKDLAVYMDDRLFKRYEVGTGKFGRTPVGTFAISERIKEPTWWRSDGKEIPFGDPENILGTRWMEIRATGDTPNVKGYGIHGTWQPESIGKAESAGCVRMRNEEVEELFDLLPLATSVTIEE